MYKMLWSKWNLSLRSVLTNLLLPCNQVPVVHKPGFQLLWDFHFDLHSIYESFLLSKQECGGKKKKKEKKKLIKRKLLTIMFTHLNGNQASETFHKQWFQM